MVNIMVIWIKFTYSHLFEFPDSWNIDVHSRHLPLDQGNSCMHPKLLQSCLTRQHYGTYPARLLCLWDPPGKNTEKVSMPFSRRSPWPRDWTHIFYTPALAGWFFLPLVPPGKSKVNWMWSNRRWQERTIKFNII